MYGRGSAPSDVPVLVVLGSAHRVLTGGSNLVVSLFVAAVTAAVAFSNQQ